MQALNEQISKSLVEEPIPSEAVQRIVCHLNPRLSLRPYQKEAFTRLIYYCQNGKKAAPPQLLFHMATGSGKTLIMAGSIIHLYQLGYRNFVFFVNSSNIINKTRDNFLNTRSSKYLFAPSVTVNGNKVNIREVQNFETTHEDNINIIFTTIQGLHTRLNHPRENSLTYEDFQDKPIVLLSDEAHHINAETKKGILNREEAKAVLSWERTVTEIFKAHKDNFLLEFTATVDLSHPEVKTKYLDKLIFDYPLSKFKNDGYSKEVKVLQTALPPFERALQAVILSQYRRKVFEDHSKLIKPVILLKSKTIAESQHFYERFIHGINSLTLEKLTRVKSLHSDTVLTKAFGFFKARGITHENLISELKEDFSESKCIAVDSKNDSEEKQLIINSLEDQNNEYRVIFAVDKLNEGWDVLNLFDIVRLYDTDTTKSKTDKVSKTTLSEAQLIGRGARYCPFKIHDQQQMYRRKYDDHPANELRVCEELYYHAAHNPSYISEITLALKVIGLNDDRKTVSKPDHRKLPENGTTISTQETTPHELTPEIRDRLYQYQMMSGAYEGTLSDRPSEVRSQENHYILELHALGRPVLRKALSRLPFYRFSHFKKHFPRLRSTTEWMDSDQFLRPIKVKVTGTPDQLEQITAGDKLNIALHVLEEISMAIQSAREI